jgi:hypothetical protein
VAALDRTLGWLVANPPDRAPSLGELGMDTWTWCLYARLHPRPAARRSAEAEARARLAAIEPHIEATATSLSWWALLLREMQYLGIDSARHRAALARLDLGAALGAMTGTTAFWTTELLRHAGMDVVSKPDQTVVAGLAKGPGVESYTPTLRDAYAVYHEIAPATDLGRRAPQAFTAEQLSVARAFQPRLYEVSLQARDLDAVAEVLVAAALLGQRDDEWYRQALVWLLGQQRDDGTWPDLRNPASRRSAGDARHAVLVASWAVLQSVAGAAGDR